MRVVVLHGGYGCDTGCCGHWVELGEEGADGPMRFRFGHPGGDEDLLEWAKDLVRQTFGEEHVADLDWENCVIEPGGHL